MAERLFGPANKHAFLHFFSPRETANVMELGGSL